MQRFVRCLRDKQVVLQESTGDLPEDVLSGSYAETDEFMRALPQGDAPRPTIEDVVPSVTLCLMTAKHKGRDHVIIHANQNV
jgi:hypothetical protein